MQQSISQRHSPSPARKDLSSIINTQKKGIDANAEFEPPLDFSFYSMTALSDIASWEPRKGYIPEPRHLRLVETEVKDNESRTSDVRRSLSHNLSTEIMSGKSHSKCLKLNNNCLPDVTELKNILEHLFENPNGIAWIDLSFNELTKIDEIITSLPHLQILYLHGNQITDMKEVEKLGRLTNLKKLSLHGNPIENEKGYKYQVLSLLPHLQVLDFTRITKADRRTAVTLDSMNKNVRKGSKKKKDSED